MRFDVVTLFPEMVLGAAHYGVTGKAIEKNIVSLVTWNPRDYATDKHKTVDDKSYGGGPGMVMKCMPLHQAVSDAKQYPAQTRRVVFLSPQGRPIKQALLADACRYSQLILIAGRYEGVDQRFIDLDCDEEWSVGDYVLSGGELAALTVIDAITRLLPGVLGDADSAEQDSHAQGLLDFPHYTRPECFNGLTVPAVLLSGNHADIQRWRTKQALGNTWLKRPDLLATRSLTQEEQHLLNEFILESNNLRGKQ